LGHLDKRGSTNLIIAATVEGSSEHIQVRRIIGLLYFSVPRILFIVSYPALDSGMSIRVQT